MSRGSERVLFYGLGLATWLAGGVASWFLLNPQALPELGARQWR